MTRICDLCMYCMPCLANDCCTSTQFEAITVPFKETTRHPDQGRCTCAVDIVCNKVCLALYAQNPSSSFLKECCHECIRPCSAFRAQSCLMRCTLPNTSKKETAGKRSGGKRVSSVSLTKRSFTEETPSFKTVEVHYVQLACPVSSR